MDVLLDTSSYTKISNDPSFTGHTSVFSAPGQSKTPLVHTLVGNYGCLCRSRHYETLAASPVTCAPVTTHKYVRSPNTCSICRLLVHLTSLDLAFKQQLLTSAHLQQRPGITKFLVGCVFSENMYVSYTTTKALISLLKEHILKIEEVKTCFLSILNNLSKIYWKESEIEPKSTQSQGDEQGGGIFSNVMTVFKEVIHLHKEEASIALRVIHNEWDNLQKLFQTILSSDQHNVSVNSFLSLLRTLTKTHHEVGWVVPAVILLAPDLFNSLRQDSAPGYLKISTIELLHQLVSLKTESDNTEILEGLCDQIIKWIISGGLDSISRTEEDIGGFGWRLSPQEKPTDDHHHLKQTACLLSLKAVSDVISRKQANKQHDLPFDALTSLKVIPNSFGRHDEVKWLERLFMNQDDMWISALIYVLNIYKHLAQSGTDDREAALLKRFNIHHCVSDFLSLILYDHTVIIDLLASPETDFLLFLLLYLKFIRQNWEDFCQAHNDYEHKNLKSPSSVEPDPHGMPSQLSTATLEPPFMERTNNEKSATEQALTSVTCTSGHPVDYKDKLFTSKPSGSLQLLSIYDSSDSEEMDTEEQSGKELKTSGSSHSEEGMCLLDSCDDSEPWKYPCQRVSKQQSQKTLKTSGDSGSAEEVEMTYTRNMSDQMGNQSSNEMKTSEECFIPESPINKTVNKGLHDSAIYEPPIDAVDFESGDSGSLDSNVDKIMSVFIRVRLALEHLTESGLFPYDIKPLLTVLHNCETLYETR